MNTFLRALSIGVFATGALLAAPPRQPGEMSRYRVNAQFRGSMNKGLGELGTVTLTERDLGPGAFSVSMAGTVRDPDEEGKSYTFSADISVKRTGNSLISRSRSHFSEDAEEYKDRILEMAPFVRVLSRDPFPSPQGPAESTFTVNQKPYTVRYATTERNVEATLYDGLRTVGKFFLSPGPRDTVHDFEKFRVNTVNKTVLSFVKIR